VGIYISADQQGGMLPDTLLTLRTTAAKMCAEDEACSANRVTSNGSKNHDWVLNVLLGRWRP
jgi:hypothetical protein